MTTQLQREQKLEIKPCTSPFGQRGGYYNSWEIERDLLIPKRSSSTQPYFTFHQTTLNNSLNGPRRIFLCLGVRCDRCTFVKSPATQGLIGNYYFLKQEKESTSYNTYTLFVFCAATCVGYFQLARRHNKNIRGTLKTPLQPPRNLRACTLRQRFLSPKVWGYKNFGLKKNWVFRSMPYPGFTKSSLKLFLKNLLCIVLDLCYLNS